MHGKAQHFHAIMCSNQRRKSSRYVRQTSILHIIHLSLPYRSQNILKICSYISCKTAKVR